MRPSPLVLLCLLSATTGSPVALAQDTLPPWEGGLTRSLGQPPRYRFFAGGTAGADWRASDLAPIGLATGGVFRSITSPITGLLGASLEGFAGFRGNEADGGVRLLLSSQTLRVSGGAEYDGRDGRVYPMLAYTTPVRRAGIFGGGSWLRIEWLPGAGSSVRASVLAPLHEPYAGRTRPRAGELNLPLRKTAAPPGTTPAPDVLLQAMASLRRAAEAIEARVVPFIDVPGPDVRKALTPGLTALRAPPAVPGLVPDGTVGTDQLVRLYHAELVRAFSIAASNQPIPAGQANPLGEELARRGRRIVLDHILYPFNRMLGQRKNKEAFQSLAMHARGNWARELSRLDNLPPDRALVAMDVFDQWIEILRRVQGNQATRWRDSRVLWLPLQFGLRPEEHDTQAELDQIVEEAVGNRFSDGNEVWYVVNEQFRREVTASIREARDYHVLWIHDFRGRNDEGEPDALSLRYVVDAYLAALTTAVREYDRRRVLPSFLIFLDQHYYEVNRGRIWLDFLERPLGALPRLPAGFAAYDSTLAAAQAALREAVASSRLLQAEARHYGAAWLANQVKVHVSVTNPSDFSFWRKDFLPVLGIPDNFMRDHRKIAFYDVSEDDPYRGLAIYTGMGIGEHYAGPTWEDRSIMVKGPVLLSLKRQARRLLLGQGLAESELPYALRDRPLASDYNALVRLYLAEQHEGHAHEQRAMELHNLTGYQAKPINVAKATLYSLMPAGAVIKVPDSLWGSAIYASLLTGSALRGVRVLFVAPSLASAPSSGWPAMGLAHDLFSRLIVVQQELGPELEASGGMLKTGIYNPGIGVEDALSRFGAAYQNARRTPFLRRLFPIDPSIDSMLVQFQAMLQGNPAAGALRGVPLAPKLHLKANWFSSREAWDSLVTRPEMKDVLEAYIGQLIGPRHDSLGAREASEALTEASRRLADAFERTLPEHGRDRVIYYLMVGSPNQDYRSMFMDGEATVLLSGWSTVLSLIDFGLIINLSVWVDDLALLDALLPPPTAFQRKVARWARPAL